MRRAILTLLAALSCAAAARATWSIVVVNHATGEVCVASATCLQGFDLKPALCVLRVGEGAAAAQSWIDTTGQNRLLIWNQLAAGTDPDAILGLLAQQDTQHQRRQYGIVSLRAGGTTFTGTLCGQARHGVSGVTGDLSYSIQGNLLTGPIVVTHAEAALLASSGDLPTRVMAAMMAARAMGGDGRCSCSSLQPTSCGAPPPSFTYSAATAFLVCARIGDVDGVCNASQGCANGQYWCDLRVIDGPPSGQDPVVRLNDQAVPFWRASINGNADHLLTRVRSGATVLPADGVTAIAVDVEMRSLEDQPVDPLGTQLVIEPQAAPGTEIATAGPVVDLGGGRLRFPLTSTGRVGEGRWRITVTHGNGWRARLWPDLELRAVAPAPLTCGREVVSATAGASVPLWLDLGAQHAGTYFQLLGTSSGTVPGITFYGVPMPLNRDRFLAQSLHHGGSATFPGTIGLLDGAGRATAGFVPPPGHLATIVGRRIEFAALVSATPAVVTNVAGFDVAP